MNPERILEAAIKTPNGVVHSPKPARHGDIIHALAEKTGKPVPGDWEQGFVTTRLRFVSRREAFEIAVRERQLKPRREGQYNGPELYSEDLW